VRSSARLAILAATSLLLCGCKLEPDTADQKIALHDAELALASCSHDSNSHYASGGLVVRSYEISGLSVNRAVSKVQRILLATGFVRHDSHWGNCDDILFASGDNTGYFLFHYSGGYGPSSVTDLHMLYRKRSDANPSVIVTTE